MATHSSVLAWRIPGMGSHRVGHDWSDLAAAAAAASIFKNEYFSGSGQHSLSNSKPDSLFSAKFTF